MEERIIIEYDLQINMAGYWGEKVELKKYYHKVLAETKDQIAYLQSGCQNELIRILSKPTYKDEYNSNTKIGDISATLWDISSWKRATSYVYYFENEVPGKDETIFKKMEKKIRLKIHKKYGCWYSYMDESVKLKDFEIKEIKPEGWE